MRPVKVFKTCCKNCLLSEDRIVSPTRAKEIITACLDENKYFTCHKASINGDDIACSKFVEVFGKDVLSTRIALGFDLIEYVDQDETAEAAFVSYKDLKTYK